MSLAVGQIVEGEVSKILKFGVFINLDGGVGLVHISEISDEYVENISDFLKIGQKVKVKILSIEDDKISLSIKATKPKTSKPIEFNTRSIDSDMSFEDKLSKFMKDSNEKLEQARSRENFKMSRRK